MRMEKLLKSAGNLPQASQKYVDEYVSKSDVLVTEVNEMMLAREDIHQLVGKANVEMMKNNHSNHARFVASILSVPNPDILIETVVWVFRAYRSRGFHPNYWAAQLNAWVDAMKKHLSAQACKDVYPLYDWFVVNIPLFTSLSEETADSSSVLGMKPEH